MTAFNATLGDKLARSREARRDAKEARKAGRKQVNDALAELSGSYAELEKTLERLTLQNTELRRNKDALRKALERTRNAACFRKQNLFETNKNVFLSCRKNHRT